MCIRDRCYGRPVIVTNNMGSCDIVEHGHNGFIVNVRDVKNIKNYIVGLGGRNISEKEIRDIINKAEQKNKNLIFQK